jgi:hypothetical protein
MKSKMLCKNTEKSSRGKNKIWLSIALALLIYSSLMMSAEYVSAAQNSTAPSSTAQDLEYLQTDKEIYLSGEIVSIFIRGQNNRFIEIETPTAKYSLFGEAGSTQKFMPSELGDYKIILLDNENILATKSFKVISNEDMAGSSVNDAGIIADNSANANSSGLSTDTNKNVISNIDGKLNLSNNLSNNSEPQVLQRKNGELLIATDKKVYVKNDVVVITLLTNKKIEIIKIMSESAEYHLLMDGETASNLNAGSRLNFIPDKAGSYIISVKFPNENVYYDINFYVTENNALGDTENISENINNSLTKIYEIINAAKTPGENIAVKDARLNQNVSINNNYKISVVNSRGEKNRMDISFYKTQKLVLQTADSNLSDLNLSNQDLSNQNTSNLNPSVLNSQFPEIVSADNLLQFEKYDVDLIPENSSIKKLRLKDFVYTDKSNIGLENVPKEKNKIPQKTIIDSYAINLDNILFSEATATITAKGNELWKCAEWNFTEQQCLGSWVKIQDLIPGQDYSLTLYAGDPGYAEILVSRAVHLDVNGSFVSDVFDSVRFLDNFWSEPIYAGESLRISFADNLSSKNDITVYVRNLQGKNNYINVYKANTSEKLAEFPIISTEGYYKVLLYDLQGESDSFDLQIANDDGDSSAFLEFDYIVDPPWANITFDRCRNITINNTVGSALANFPAYVNVTYDSDMLSNYADLRFYNNSCNNGGVLLDYEIENYTANSAHAWVRIPSLPTGVSTISVYYKNNTNVASAQNVSGVWDVNYMMIQHMEENPAGTAPQMKDSTRYGNNGTSNGSMTASQLITGMVDGATSLDGVNDFINISRATTIEPAAAVTISTWIYWRNVTVSNSGKIVCKTPVTNVAPYVSYCLEQNGTTNGIEAVVNVGGTRRQTLNRTVSLNAWHYIVGTWSSGDGVRLYVDGQLATNTTAYAGTITYYATPLRIGFSSANQAGTFVNASVDEVRLSNVSRSAAWINLTYLLIANQTRYVAIGAEMLRSDTFPVVNLQVPADNFINDTNQYVNLTFNATVTAENGLKNCSLWTNYSGVWLLNQTQTVSNVSNVTNFNLTNLVNKTFIWNIICVDNLTQFAYASANRTVKLNWTDRSPNLSLSYPDDNLVNDTDRFVNLTFNASVFDDVGLSNCSLWTNYTGVWAVNQTQNISGTVNISTFNLTNLYNRTFIWNIGCYDNVSNFALSDANRTVIVNWSDAGAPDVFNLNLPANFTESEDLNPTLSWQQTTEPNFANYTLLITDDPSFNTVDFSYSTYLITDTSVTLTSALNPNTNYYWKVLASDIIGNQRNSTQTFQYVTSLLLYPHTMELYSALQSADVDMIALDNNTIVIAWVENAPGYNISFQVRDINGTAITPKTVVDATGASTSRVSLSPVNRTQFILSIFDQPQNNVDFFIYDKDGSSVVGRTNAAVTVGANTDVKVSQLGDRFPLAYSRTSNGDAELRIFSNSGASLLGVTQIDTNMAPELPGQSLVAVSAVNSSAFAYSWFDDATNDATYDVRSSTGTSIVSQADYDTDVGETAQIASSSLGNNTYVAAYYDSTDDDITIDVRRIAGAVSTSLNLSDIDTNAGIYSRLDVATILMENIPDFVVVWLDTSDNTIKAGVYNQSGYQMTAPFNVTTTPNLTFPTVAAVGYEPVINVGLCNGTFMVAYTNSTGGSIIQKYWYNGSPWNGICIDYVPPTIELNEPANDSNLTTNIVSFNFTGTDDRDLVLNNCSLWTNISASWQRNVTLYDVTSGSKTNITLDNLADGAYIWNVQCYDNSSNDAVAPANYTLRINSLLPWIRNQAINATTINQSDNVKFNVTITDFYGIKQGIVTLRYPNTTEVNYTLNNSGNEYYYVFNETVQAGTYDLILIFAQDNLSQDNYNSSFTLQFNVTTSAPSAFNLLSPVNLTESSQLVPNFSWQQTSEATFANYTLLVTTDATFQSVDFTYNLSPITNTSFVVTYALDANTRYYWKVLATDIFGNQRNSTQEYIYITDTLGPSIVLNIPQNGTFWTTPNVWFNYSPTDTNSLQSCILYGNFTGAFARNQTNTTILKDDYNYFNLTLAEGTYLWAVYCNDSALNGKFSSENSTFFLDLSGPTINLTTPLNNSKENTTNNVVFMVNATDKYTNISSCSLIVNNSVEQTKYTISKGVAFNFTNFLLNGNYTWRINCTDTNGFSTLSGVRNLAVEVIDTNAPLVTPNYPAVNQYISQSNVTFNFTPEDATGIANCSLYIDGAFSQSNRTNIQNFVYNYFNVSGFTDGSHTWRVDCYDNSTGHNLGQSNLRTFSIDTVNPQVTLNLPGDNTYRTTNSASFAYTPSDLNLANCTLYGNFTGAFLEDQTNLTPANAQQNLFFTTLSDGLYIWNVLCYDLSARNTFAAQNYSVKVDTLPPTYSDISVYPDNAVYNVSRIYEFNITWQDNFNVSSVIIESNFNGSAVNNTLPYSSSGIYKFNKGNISAGTYYYKWYATDEANHTNETVAYEYIVQKANSSVNLQLNGAHANVSVNEITSVTINAALSIPTAGYLELFIDGQKINNGTAPLSNSTTVLLPGNHNVTAVYIETQNYTSSYDTLFIIVNDTIPPAIQLLSPQDNGYAGSGTVIFQYNISDKSNISNCSLYINNALNQTNNTVELFSTQFFAVDMSSGNYTWKVECTDNSNNINSSATRSLNVVYANTVKTMVNTSKTRYERGEIGLVTTKTEDIFGNALVTNVTTDIIEGITSLPWWNTSWNFRKAIIINNSVNRNRLETIELNVTGLDGNITSCNELRLVRNTTSNGMIVQEAMPLEIISGVNPSCLIRFNLELKANITEDEVLYVYYGNPSASAPSYTLNKTGTWVQRGTVSGTGATLTATIDDVDTSKTLILYTSSSTSSLPTQSMFTATMSLSNEITFTKYGTGTAASITWQAIQSDDLTVQRDNLSYGTGTTQLNVTINPVNLSKAFIVINGRVSSTTAGNTNQGYFTAKFVNESMIQVERRTTGTAAMAVWQVAEWNNSIVQSGNTSFTTTLQNGTVTAVDLSRSLLFFGFATTGGTGVGSNLIMGNITNTTRVTFEKQYAVGTAYVEYFVVTLPEEFAVQTRSVSMSTDQNIALSTVDINKAFHTQSWTSSGTTATTYTNTFILANLTNTTNLLLNKQSTTNTHVVRMFIVNTTSGTKYFGPQQKFIQQNASQTDSLGYFSFDFNTSNKAYGNYSAVSTGLRGNYINETNHVTFEIIPDNTSPNIMLTSPEHLIERGVGYMNFSYIPFDINLKNCSLYINTNGTFNKLDTNTSPANNESNIFYNIYLGVGLQNWSVACYDENGNLGFASPNRTVNITGPDLKVTNSNLYFGSEDRVEGVNITIFVNISNIGLTVANNSFIVQFFRGDPDAGGTQIGSNIIIPNLSIGENVTVNTTQYKLAAGRNQIFVKIDTANTVNETNENNNKANNNISVNQFQYYYGNISGRIILAGGDGVSLMDYDNVTPEYGLLIFADEDSVFSFRDLKPLTRNKNNQLTGDDFSNVDTAMSTTNFDDSIKNTWGGGTDVPLHTKTFNLSAQNITNVPVIDSTNTSDFVTGILWDTADDTGNLQYDATDREDLIFVTEINPAKQGFYGTYDAEVKIPAALRTYKTGHDNIIFYVEIK